MLIAIGKFGEMLDAPSPYELSETFLKREVDEAKKSPSHSRRVVLSVNARCLIRLKEQKFNEHCYPLSSENSLLVFRGYFSKKAQCKLYIFQIVDKVIQDA